MHDPIFLSQSATKNCPSLSEPSNQLNETIKTKASQNAHRRYFRDFRAGEGLLPEAEVLAFKHGVSLQLQQILEQERITKTELASRMKTSRASLDQMLDPSNPSLTAASLGKATAGLGRKVELRFVPA